MKNKLGKRENLREYHENGKLAYEFMPCLNRYCYEATYDDKGNHTSYRTLEGFSWIKTFDSQNRVTSYKDSSGVYWKRIYNENGTYEQIDLIK